MRIYDVYTRTRTHTATTLRNSAISCCGWPANVIIAIIINIHHDALLVGKLQGRIEVLITVYQVFETRACGAQRYLRKPRRATFRALRLRVSRRAFCALSFHASRFVELSFRVSFRGVCRRRGIELKRGNTHTHTHTHTHTKTTTTVTLAEHEGYHDGKDAVYGEGGFLDCLYYSILKDT